MIICGTTVDEALRARLQALVDAAGAVSRTALAKGICRDLGWHDALGRPRVVSCRIAVGRLAVAGLLRLPPPLAPPPPRALVRPLPEAPEPPGLGAFQGPLADLGRVCVRPVATPREARLWRAMMRRYHYLGAGPLCGAQLCYLVCSPLGVLGGLAFSAAAWRVTCRDQWIGWDEPTRQHHRHLVLCNSRLLILPQVRVPHLASHVLGRCLRRLPADWQARYGYMPVLLETFVEQARFRGTCYRASNWQVVGLTQGRGRQDRQHQCQAGLKQVLLYPLRPDARQRLCQGMAHPADAASPPPGAGPPAAPARATAGAEDWVANEFGQAPLGDARLRRRLGTVADSFYRHPQANLPQACGSPAALKGAYRLFDHEQATMTSLLDSHYQATRERVSSEAVVLAVQDSSTINYTGLRRKTTGLGPIGARSGATGALGLILHDTLAFTPAGLPLGLVAVQCWARPKKSRGKQAKQRLRHQLPEHKESGKWLHSYHAASALQRQCPHTQVVSVGDREADFFDLFDQARGELGGAALLVRAKYDRSLLMPPGAGLRQTIAATPPSGTITLDIPRQARHPARRAVLSVSYCQVIVQPPDYRRAMAGGITLSCILVREDRPPVAVAPLEWLLLCNLPVNSLAEASEKIGWYARRWGIESYHRILKSGCHIEERQLGSVQRLENCLAIDLVVAWRVFHLTLLGRQQPELPCSVYFSADQWQALCLRTQHPQAAPSQPPTLGTAMRQVASLGGFLGRKSDGDPGPKSLWLGLQRLDDLTDMYVRLRARWHPHPHPPALPRNRHGPAP